MAKSDYPLVIVGAGAAGLGASEVASKHAIEHIVLEASHRRGGRGLTESLATDIHIDLGCRWMHSASLNPYVQCATRLGFDYSTVDPPRQFIFYGESLSRQAQQAYAQAEKQLYAAIHRLGEQGIDHDLWQCIADDSPWAGWLSYRLSMLHSNDPDQVSLMDAYHYRDTGEDWPLKQGYGELICRQGQHCPVRCNTAVEAIDWRGPTLKLHTQRGQLSAQQVVVTVSTGVLASGDIRFTPPLPEWKQHAVYALPMGNYNNLFYLLTPGCLEAREQNVCWHDGEQSLSLYLNPFGQPYLFACTAGRFAWWLEKQGERASEAFLREVLGKIFGSDFSQHLRRFKASAWGFDPWVKGAYASAVPGQGAMRAELARSIAARLHFAGEATSTDFLNTAHGAYLSGQRAAKQAIAMLES